jgi:hypothetical protein
MNLSIAAKFGLPALALAAALVACPQPDPVVTKTTFTVSPIDKATGVLETSKVVLTYTAAMADAAKTSVTLKDGTTVVPSTPVWDAAKKVLTVTPTSTLGFSRVISVVVAAAKDGAGGDVDAKTTTFTVKAGTTTGQTTQSLATDFDGTIVKDLDGNASDVPAPAVIDATVKFAFYPLSTDSATSAIQSEKDRKISMRVGNVNNDSVGRGVLRFTVPATVNLAKVAKAELILTEYKLEGTGAWARGLTVEGTDFGPGVATSQGVATSDSGVDFSAAAVGAAVSGGTTDPGLEAKVTLDVSAYVQALPAAKIADFRLKFGTEQTVVPGTNSGVRFYSNDAIDATVRPVLKLTINP